MKPADAIVVVALLAFAFGWVAGGCWLLMVDPVEDISTWDALTIFGLIAFPAMWAGGLVSRIVKGPWGTR
jgi:hypothetical protein